MSELINNSTKRKDLLKHMILQLHKGIAPDAVKKQILQLLGQVPYGEVVEVEQELISEGLPREEVMKLCDVHTEALKGVIDEEGAKEAEAGHPVHTFIQENRALQLEIANIEKLYSKIESLNDTDDAVEIIQLLRTHFNSLSDVEKHYRRKENLLFPFLEKYGITGPSTVMWGKHDEIREYLKTVLGALSVSGDINGEEAKTVAKFVLHPTTKAIEEMIYKEEHILFPMSMDKLSDSEWYDIHNQSLEIGYCLYDPKDWKPVGIERVETEEKKMGRIQLSSGNFTVQELEAILNTLPVDITFVDNTDTVRYFSQGKERIFDRTRAILGRQVQLCHPPASVHVVEKILEDFRSGKQDRAAFWINLKGKFVYIVYFALRNQKGDYLGTLEVSQDLTELRTLEGEQRILNYVSEEKDDQRV